MAANFAKLLPRDGLNLKSPDGEAGP